MKKFILTAVCAVVLAGSAMAKEKQDTTVVFTVNPVMICQNCENKIKSNLRFEKGITDIQTSLKEQNVKVTFNTKKTNVSNLVKGFKKIGYEAKEVNGACQSASKVAAAGSCCSGKDTKKEKECCSGKDAKKESCTGKCH